MKTVGYVVALPFFFLLCVVELLKLKSLLACGVRLYDKWLRFTSLEGVKK